MNAKGYRQFLGLHVTNTKGSFVLPRPDNHCHVAWLASLAADLFGQWSNEVDGIIGHATSRVVRT